MGGFAARVPWRADWPWFAILYSIAFGLRWAVVGGAIYGDEGFHYYVSRTWGAPAPNVHVLDRNDVDSLRHLFWWRPAFMALLTPGALISFDAYRALFVFYNAFLPVLVAGILRALNVRRVVAYGAGLLFALHPYYISWGVRVFPDALMAIVFLAGVWAWIRDRPLLAACAFMVSVWTKESAVVGLLAVFVLASGEGPANPFAMVWPLRLNKLRTGLVGAGLFGLAPLYYALQTGLRFPGWGRGGELPPLADRFFLTAWLLPLVIVGLWWTRTRRIALLALVYPAFYVVYRLRLGRAVEVWYYALPAALAIIAAAFALDELTTRCSTRGPRARWVPKAVAVAACVILGGQIAMPITAESKAWTMPASHIRDPSLAETLRFENIRDRSFPDTLAQLSDSDWQNVFLVDIHWFFVNYPFGLNAGTVRSVLAGGWYPDQRQVNITANYIGSWANSTVLLKWDAPMNHAIRETFADCKDYENADYWIIRGAACAGRQEALWAAYQARIATL